MYLTLALLLDPPKKKHGLNRRRREMMAHSRPSKEDGVRPRNLIDAARRSGSPKILAQSVAWQLPDGPDAQAVAELERSVLAEGGVVLRYGQFYGPGTYNEQQPPAEPRVHIDRAAERTVEALGEPTGVVVIID